MKIRQGYVSNSSSSSFLVVGKQIFFEDIGTDFKNVWVKGKQLNDGVDFFSLDKTKYKFIKKMKNREDFKFYKVNGFCEVGQEFSKIITGKKQKLYFIEQDNNYSVDNDDLQRRYCREQPQIPGSCISFFGKEIMKKEFEQLFDKKVFEQTLNNYECIYVVCKKETEDFSLKRIKKMSELYLQMKETYSEVYYYLVKFQHLNITNQFEEKEDLTGMGIYHFYVKKCD